MTRGTSRTRSSGVSQRNQPVHSQPRMSLPCKAIGSTPATSSDAVVMDTSRATARADPVRRRGTPWSRASSAWATNWNTVPGM